MKDSTVPAMDKERLPQTIAEMVHALHADDDILLSISSDISGDGSYGEDWLVVTDQYLLTFAANALKPTHDLRIDKLDKISV